MSISETLKPWPSSLLCPLPASRFHYQGISQPVRWCATADRQFRFCAADVFAALQLKWARIASLQRRRIPSRWYGQSRLSADGRQHYVLTLPGAYGVGAHLRDRVLAAAWGEHLTSLVEHLVFDGLGNAALRMRLRAACGTAPVSSTGSQG